MSCPTPSYQKKSPSNDIPIDVCLDVAGVMLLLIDPDGRVALINQKGCEILGCTEYEVVGRDWFEHFVPERSRKAVRAIFDDMMTGRLEDHEHEDDVVLTANGTERVMHWHNAVVRNDTGDIVGTLSSGLDVTELREREAALQEAEGRSRALLDTTVDAIITADEEGRIESFNRAAERMFGYDRDEAEGKNLGILMPPLSEEHDGFMRSYLKTGKKKVIGIGREDVGMRKDGTTFPIDLAVSEFVAGGQRKFAGVIRDISERRRLENEVLRISEEERERIGRDLHDGLGSLLSGTALGLQAIIRRAERGETVDAADLERVASMIEEGANQAHALSRGLNPVRLETEGLAAALSELAANVRLVTDVACEYTGPTEIPSIERPIATQIYRIAQEAVNNAVKHANATRIDVEVRLTNKSLQLTVRDDGVGLKGVKSEDGLGMHIMPYRARLIGGQFRIKEGPRGGVTATCTVPLEPALEPLRQPRR